MTSNDNVFSTPSDFGGPADFTENMSRYFADDLSDFVGTPVDMSTPPHLLQGHGSEDPKPLGDVAGLQHALEEETAAENSTEMHYQPQPGSLKSSFAKSIASLHSNHASSTKAQCDQSSTAEAKESSLKSELEPLELERFENLRSTPSSLESNVPDPRRSVKDLQELLSAAEEREIDLKLEIDTLRDSTTLDRESMQTLTSEVKRLKDLASSHAESMKLLQESLSAADNRESNLKAELEAVRNSSRGTKEFKDLQSSYEETISLLRQSLVAAGERESKLKVELEAARASESDKKPEAPSSYKDSMDSLYQSLTAAEKREFSLKSELEAVRSSAERLKTLQSSYEESIGSLRQSLSAAREREANLSTELKALRVSAAADRESVQDLVREAGRLDDLKSSHANAISKIQSQIESTRSLHQRLSAMEERELNLNSELRNLRHSVTNDREEVRVLTREVERLDTMESTHARAVSDFVFTQELYQRLSAAEERESSLKAELEKLRNTAALDRTNMHTLANEVERLEFVIAAKDEAAKELDRQLVLTSARQKQEWQRRMDTLLDERNHMAKVLMYVWGEKEAGNVRGKADENGQRAKQVYRYKYYKARRGLFDV